VASSLPKSGRIRSGHLAALHRAPDHCVHPGDDRGVEVLLPAGFDVCACCPTPPPSNVNAVGALPRRFEESLPRPSDIRTGIGNRRISVLRLDPQCLVVEDRDLLVGEILDQPVVDQLPEMAWPWPTVRSCWSCIASTTPTMSVMHGSPDACSSLSCSLMGEPPAFRARRPGGTPDW